MPPTGGQFYVITTLAVIKTIKSQFTSGRGIIHFPLKLAAAGRRTGITFSITPTQRQLAGMQFVALLFVTTSPLYCI